MTRMTARARRRSIVNLIFVAACGLTAVIALGALALIGWSLLSKGIGGINGDLFTMSQPAPGSRGGLLNAIVGSVILCGLAMVFAVAVGVLAGTWLSEYGGRTKLGHAVRFLNDVLLSAPSILIGLFVSELLVRNVIGHFLAVPIVTRTTEDILLLQPTALREAGMALGATRAFVVRKIVWRSAATGLLTAGLLGFARISGETAPLLFTSLGNQFFSMNLLQPIASLPTTIFQFALSAYDDWQRLAWAGALLIAASVLAINIAGRAIIHRKAS